MTVLPSRFVEEPAPAIACCFGKERFDTPQRAYDVLRSRKATRPQWWKDSFGLDTSYIAQTQDRLAHLLEQRQ